MLMLFGCCVAVTGMVAQQVTPQDIPAPPSAATVDVEFPAKKLKRGKMYTAQVKVDLTAVTAPGTNQPAAIGSYVVPITFDRTALEFVSVAGGDSAPFASGPTSATNPAAANAAAMVTVAGAQTTSDSTTGAVFVAGLTFKVIAGDSGSTALGVNPQLAAPGLSLASPSGGLAVVPYRIGAVGQASSFRIK